MDQLRKDRVHLNAQLPELEPAYRIKLKQCRLTSTITAQNRNFSPARIFKWRIARLGLGSSSPYWNKIFLIHSRHLKQLCVPDVNGRPDQSDAA